MLIDFSNIFPIENMLFQIKTNTPFIIYSTVENNEVIYYMVLGNAADFEKNLIGHKITLTKNEALKCIEVLEKFNFNVFKKIYNDDILFVNIHEDLLFCLNENKRNKTFEIFYYDLIAFFHTDFLTIQEFKHFIDMQSKLKNM